MRVSGEAVGGGGHKELSLSFPAPCSRILFACDLSQRACLQAVKVFIFVRDGCIVITMAHSMPSVPAPLKAFCQVLTSPLPPDI